MHIATGDVAMGLVPIEGVGRRVDFLMTVTATLVALAWLTWATDFCQADRNLERIGLTGPNADSIRVHVGISGD